MWKNNVISKSSKLHISKKSKDASSSSNEVYSISKIPLKRKTNKQIVLTSKFKKEHTKENNSITGHQQKEINTKNLFNWTIFGVLFA